jgi:hypothetical protein
LRSIHYAWDLMAFEKQVLDGIKLLSGFIKPWRHMCYILTGFNTSFEEDEYRFRRIREMGVDPYIMPYNLTFPTVKHRHYARWVNGRYHTICDFEEFEPWVKAQSNIQITLFEGGM